MNYFQNKIDGETSPLCRLCEEEDETFIHWLTECPVLREHQTEIFGIATNEYILIPDKWDLNKVLEFSFIPNIACIIETGTHLGIWI